MWLVLILILILDFYFWSSLFIYFVLFIFLIRTCHWSHAFLAPILTLFLCSLIFSSYFFPYSTSVSLFFTYSSTSSLLISLLLSFLLIDVGIEATIMAAALAQPKSPFRIASSMIHCDPDEYNSYVLTIYLPVYCVESVLSCLFLSCAVLPCHALSLTCLLFSFSRLSSTAVQRSVRLSLLLLTL